jgi:hypothetical protein
LEILRVEGYRKFCNKIFNATKFAMLKLDESFVPEAVPKPTGNESIVEKWIFHKLNVAASEINQALVDRNFMNATNAAYNFWLYELCDVYIVGDMYLFFICMAFSWRFTGSHETHDRRQCPGCCEEVCSANSLHLLGLWSEVASPLHAVRDGGIVATSSQKAK